MSFVRPSNEVSRHLFEKYSDFYDNSGFINNYLGKWDIEISNMAPPTPLLDIGCGPGRLLNKLLLAGYTNLSGIDITRRGLQLAKSKVFSSGMDSSVSFAEALAEFLPFADNSFNSITISGVLHHMEKPEVVLNEAARVLKNNGTLIIADPYFPPLMRHFINAVLSIYPIAGDRRFNTSEGVEKLARRSGFEKKKMINMPLAYILVFQKCFNSAS